MLIVECNASEVFEDGRLKWQREVKAKKYSLKIKRLDLLQCVGK